jgi:hypothetical protein
LVKIKEGVSMLRNSEAAAAPFYQMHCKRSDFYQIIKKGVSIVRNNGIFEPLLGSFEAKNTCLSRLFDVGWWGQHVPVYPRWASV